MAVKELEMKPFSKKGYKTFRFEDIAFSISERVEPKQTELKIYVGLEHIDANSVHIKRHGTPTDVDGTKLKVYPGDLIFGKRRAYQRKAAIANFEGICSAHAMVLRANPKIIIPELFPFFIHSDQFMNRAIDISVGSLSPTINWGALKTQEFVLPPKEQQVKLAELLWAGDALLEKNINLFENILILIASREKEIFNVKSKGFDNIPLEKAAWYQEGPGLRNWQFTTEGIKVINVTNLKDGVLDLESTDRFVDWKEYKSKYKHFECDEGDIVVASSGNSYCKHAVVRKKDLPLLMNTSVIRFKALKGTNYQYLNLFLKSKNFKDQIDKLIEGGAQPNFGPYHLRKVFIPMPTESAQEKLASSLNRIENEKVLIEKHIENIKLIQKQLINQIFGG